MPPVPNTPAYCLATMGSFWFPYFSLNLYIHWCSYTFFLGNAPWVLMLIYLVSNSLSPTKIICKNKKHIFFPKIWATESFQNEFVRAKSLQSWVALCDAMDSSPPGSSAYGILQARMLESVAMFPSRGIFLTQVSNSYLWIWMFISNVTNLLILGFFHSISPSVPLKCLAKTKGPIVCTLLKMGALTECTLTIFFNIFMECFRFMSPQDHYLLALRPLPQSHNLCSREVQATAVPIDLTLLIKKRQATKHCVSALIIREGTINYIKSSKCSC